MEEPCTCPLCLARDPMLVPDRSQLGPDWVEDAFHLNIARETRPFSLGGLEGREENQAQTQREAWEQQQNIEAARQRQKIPYPETHQRALKRQKKHREWVAHCRLKNNVAFVGSEPLPFPGIAQYDRKRVRAAQKARHKELARLWKAQAAGVVTLTEPTPSISPQTTTSLSLQTTTSQDHRPQSGSSAPQRVDSSPQQYEGSDREPKRQRTHLLQSSAPLPQSTATLSGHDFQNLHYEGWQAANQRSTQGNWNVTQPPASLPQSTATLLGHDFQNLHYEAWQAANQQPTQGSWNATQPLAPLPQSTATLSGYDFRNSQYQAWQVANQQRTQRSWNVTQPPAPRPQQQQHHQSYGV